MALVDELRAKGSVRSAAVEAAMRTVPRHVFLPGVPLERAYANDAVVTKSASDGSSLSLASQPGVVAMMLEQLEVRAGDRVLEIGAGTGYNAALLACLAGAGGRVTTVDLDEDITDAARRNLAAAGYERVRVVCGDGEFGAEDDAPFDRLTATVSAWDLPPSWLDQLSGNGRIVVPLRLRGLIRSVAFERVGGHLVSRSVEPVGFVPMRGVGAYAEQLVHLDQDGNVTLKIDGSMPADADALRSAADEPAVLSWTSAMLGAEESFCPLDLWLAGIDGFCRISARWQPAGTGLVRLALPIGTDALVRHGSFAYLTVRKADPGERPGQGTSRYELGAAGYGLDGSMLAADLAGQVQEWDRNRRGGPGPRIDAYSEPGNDRPASRLLVNRRHNSFAVVYS
jgi:protein-L-isoaspartate(D-aspartate) O-methyltransferase